MHYEKIMNKFFYSTFGPKNVENVPVHPISLLEKVDHSRIKFYDDLFSKLQNSEKPFKLPPIPVCRVPYWYRVTAQDMVELKKKGFKILVKNGLIFILYAGAIVAILLMLWHFLVNKKELAEAIQKFLEWLKIFFNIGNPVGVNLEPNSDVKSKNTDEKVEITTSATTEGITSSTATVAKEIGKALAIIPGKELVLVLGKELIVFMGDKIIPYLNNSLDLYAYQPQFEND